ncbi:hypothetical protein SAMN02910292_02085 [Lachnospiraceae bacterium XBB2008]|nr:hypothetical protein SAMN02910292_02085 [Lachnospiraceae bacterium XBB2008]
MNYSSHYGPYYSNHCWNCKEPFKATLLDTCTACGWVICKKCDCCTSACRFNKKHDTKEYKDYVAECHAAIAADTVNSFAGKTARLGIGLAKWAAVLATATVETAVRAVPYLINPESDTTKKIEDAFEGTNDKIQKTADELGLKAGKAIDKILGKDSY